MTRVIWRSATAEPSRARAVDSSPQSTGVRIGQCFGVAFVELGGKRLGLRPLARGTNRVFPNVDAGDPDPAPRSDQSKLAGPAGHIEQRRPWRDAHAVEELDGARLHEAGETIVVARHPRRPKAMLQGMHLGVRNSCTQLGPPR